VLYIINAAERIKVSQIKIIKDSVFIQMPVFESQFKAKIISNKKWEGVWIKGGAVKDAILPFIAELSDKRFDINQAAKQNISGTWAATFKNVKGTEDPAIAEFQQHGNILSGTILTTTGDYRYLSGSLNGDTLSLSTFDGGHAFLFTAIVNNDHSITNGKFYSGVTFSQDWYAEKNDHPVLPNSSAMFLRAGEERLNFRFPDLNNKMVSINDAKFKNKVVIIQIMGSWCPNCMDETAFLSEYYQNNKQRGIEVIALAYEYSTDVNRSIKSIQKFKDRFNVQYPMLNTGVTVNDSLRTEKTLPQLTPIKMFPSTIIIGKDGKVKKIDTGFFGPGTSEHYIAFKKEFEATINALLKE
jgi:peroxiredoxin